MIRQDRRTNLLTLFGSVIAVFALIAACLTLPADIQKVIIREGGFIETASAVGYLLCVILMFALWGVRASLNKWYFSAILILFACRELDLDKRGFTEGLLKSRQYIGDTVPLLERAGSAIILIAILLTIATLVRGETRVFLRGLRQKSPAAFAVLAGIVFIGIFKTLDGLARKLEPFGINIGEQASQMASTAEEIGELGIPVMFAMAIIFSVQNRRTT